ncbi:MAG TPA: transposase [Candidatus Paceibacterota bacterium]
MNRKISFAPGEFYHLYNRGVEKRTIFSDENDWRRFQKTLFFLNNTFSVDWRIVRDKPFSTFKKDSLVAIGAYCLMPNHFHLLVKEVREGGISMFMEKITTSHAKYFNKKYERVGALFQGTFKSEHVASDEYLKYLFAYIHLNPVKLVEPKWKEMGLKDMMKVKDYLGKFSYSSYADYLGRSGEERLILDKDEFPEYFNRGYAFQEFVEDWLTFKPNT